jgi:hypothetical protein
LSTFGIRAALVIVAGTALVAVSAGLARLGIPLSFAGARASAHGPLFVLGVFFTLISLERAVALGAPLGYVAPGFGLGTGLSLVTNWAALRPAAALAALALVLVNAALYRKQASAHMVLMLVGSLSLLAANVAWITGSAVSDVVPSWLTFFVLTIVAERVELARFVAPPRAAVRALLLLGFSLAGSTLLGLLGLPSSERALGLVLALIGLWLLRYDLGRRTVRQPGLPRYAALCVLSGAGWLVLAGSLLAALGLPPAGPSYDAILHAVFVGFVLSMVFGHAPVILPAVARIALPFHGVLYAPLCLLHVGLLARCSGDLVLLPWLRQAGGLLNALALVTFVACAIWVRRHGAAGHDANHALGAV